MVLQCVVWCWGHPSQAAIPLSVGRLFQPQTSKYLACSRPLYVHTQHFCFPFASRTALFLRRNKYLDWLGVSCRNSWIAERSLRRLSPNPRNGEKVSPILETGRQWGDQQLLRGWWKRGTRTIKGSKFWTKSNQLSICGTGWWQDPGSAKAFSIHPPQMHKYHFLLSKQTNKSQFILFKNSKRYFE